MSSPKHFNNYLESLRGFVALNVVVHHLSNLGIEIDPHYKLSNAQFLALPGHLGVLVFFVLSGYVMGVANKKGLKLADVIPYLKKRLIRLYPIYFLVVLLTVCVLSPNLPLKQLIANLTFSQVFVAPVINDNSPLWSLAFEVVYYLLFIIIALTDVNAIIAVALFLMVGVINLIIDPYHALFSSVSFGFCFWLAGLALSRFMMRTTKRAEADYKLMISNCFLLLAVGGYNFFGSVFKFIETHIYPRGFDYPDKLPLFDKIISLHDLSYLPYCLLFIANFGLIEYRGKKQISFFLQILPIFNIIYVYFIKGNADLSIFLMPTIWYVISTTLYFIPDSALNKTAEKLVKVGAYFGSISYSIYIIHHPIIQLLKRVEFFSGSLFTYLMRIIFLLASSVFIAHWLEKKYQPFMRNTLLPKILSFVRNG